MGELFLEFRQISYLTAQSMLTTAWVKLTRSKFRIVNFSYLTANVELLS